MSVTIEADCIRLAGRCLAQDAEPLLVALQEHPTLRVEIGGLQKLHLAVLQVLLAARPTVTGEPDNAFLAKHVADLVR